MVPLPPSTSVLADGRTLTSLPSCFATKLTQPPEPWLNKEDTRKLQKEGNVLRYLGHKTNLASVWNKLREVGNKIKTRIKSIKRAFFRWALSFNKTEELWNTIHRILHPRPQPIKADPDALNKHFRGSPPGVLVPLFPSKFGCVALFPLLFLICSVLFHRTHLSPPQRPQKASFKGPNAKIAGLILFCLN